MLFSTCVLVLVSFSELPGVASPWPNHFSCSLALFLLLPDRVGGQKHHPSYHHKAPVLGSSHEDTVRITSALAEHLIPARAAKSQLLIQLEPCVQLWTPPPDTLLAGSLTRWMVWMQPSEISGFWSMGRKTLAWASLSTGTSSAVHCARQIRKILNCNLTELPGFQSHRFYKTPIFRGVRQHISSKQEVFFLPSKS